MRGDNKKSSFKKFFTAFLLLMAAGFSAYYFTPLKSFADNLAEQTKALAFLSIHGTREQVRNFIDDKVLPKNTEAQRIVLINELKNNLNKIKTKITNQGISISGGVNATGTTSVVNRVVGDSEKILNQLETTNGSQSVIQSAVDRILDVILPAKESVTSCGKTQ